MSYSDAHEGLDKMYGAYIGMVICIIFTLIPVINIAAAIGTIICTVVYYVGVYQVGNVIDGCRTSFVLSMTAIVISVISGVMAGLFGEGLVMTIVVLFATILEVAAMCFLYISVSKELSKNHEVDLSYLGYVVLALGLIVVACEFFDLSPIINTLLAILNYLLSIIFFKKSSKMFFSIMLICD